MIIRNKTIFEGTIFLLGFNLEKIFKPRKKKGGNIEQTTVRIYFFLILF